MLNPLDTFIERNHNNFYLNKSLRAVIRRYLTPEQILAECIKLCRLYNNGYVIYESFASDYENIKEIFVLLGSILEGINNVIFILAIILLFSFILATLMYKKVHKKYITTVSTVKLVFYLFTEKNTEKKIRTTL